MIFRRLLALVATCLLASVFAGCSNASDKPRNGGVFRMGVANLATLDPAESRSVEEVMVADQLFDSLTRWNSETLQAEAAIASTWTVSSDLKTYDFTLRSDATFTNGRPITSTDVKYSIERVSRPGSTSSLAEVLAPINGFVAWHVDGATGGFAGLITPAPNVVRFSLDQPWAGLPSALANPGFGIVPREIVESPDAPFAEQPVGSGPFEYIDRAEDGTVRLAPRTGIGAYVREINLVPFATAAEAYQRFTEGELEWSRVPPDVIAGDAGGEGYIDAQPYLAVLYYGLNVNDPALADVRFREAIVRAVDRDAIRRQVYGETTDVIDGVVPRGVFGSQDDPCGGKCTYDRGLATQLVNDAYTLRDPPEVIIDYEDDPVQQAVAERIEVGVEAVGIPATLRPHPADTYDDFVRSGGVALFRLGWVASYPSADAYLMPQFGSAQPGNFVNLNNATVDSALSGANSTTDVAQQEEFYRQAESAVMEDFAAIPIAQFKIFAAVSDRVRGFDLKETGTFDATQVWLTSG